MLNPDLIILEGMNNGIVNRLFLVVLLFVCTDLYGEGALQAGVVLRARIPVVSRSQLELEAGLRLGYTCLAVTSTDVPYAKAGLVRSPKTTRVSPESYCRLSTIYDITKY